MKKRFYEHRQKYKIVRRATLKSLADELEKSGGDIHCMPFGATMLLDPSDDDLEPIPISTCWPWIQDSSPNKKVWLMFHQSESHKWLY